MNLLLEKKVGGMVTTKAASLIFVGLLALAGAIVFASYQITSEMALSRQEAGSPEGKAQAGRYVTTVSGNSVFLLDSATGKSWLLVPDRGWVRAPTTAPTAADELADPIAALMHHHR
jgi:hypothetical protein